jgi:3-methyladenine DNA glycosylase AlkC
MSHPAQRFRAPASIQPGVPLKHLLDRTAIALMAESFAAVMPRFRVERFCAAAERGLEPLELMPRAAHIAAALAEALPSAAREANGVLIAALGPPLSGTSGHGLAPFFYLPHSSFLAKHGIADFASGMAANYQLTRRFSAEFAIRPYLIADPAAALATLTQWAADPDPHVRRLVSEGTRPRLPWAMRLPHFQRDPQPVLPLLERLKDDPELYVRRSVANHLGDIAKDHPELVFNRCKEWLGGCADLPHAQAEARRWLVRHAVRHPAKQGIAAALKLRQKAARRRA